MDDADDEAAGTTGLFGSMVTAAGPVEVEAVFFSSAFSVTFLLVTGPIVQAISRKPTRKVATFGGTGERKRVKNKRNGCNREKTKGDFASVCLLELILLGKV